MNRKRYSREFKEKVIKEAIEVGNISAVARRTNYLLAKWVRKETNPDKHKEPVKSKKDLELENQRLKTKLGEGANSIG